ncbi:MAG: HAMP domain-containing protein [Proteobacteria bacterium]|nr:HAMP domain-containing protein [Pseudomonadota bacterium]
MATLYYVMSLKIRHKLFLAILAANILLAVSIYALNSWSFNRGFRDYLDRADAERLAPLAEALAEEYRIEGNWNWVRNHYDDRWPRLVRQYTLTPGRMRRPPRGMQGDPREMRRGNIRPMRRQGFERGRPPPPGEQDPFAVNPRLFLADNQHRLIIGNPRRQRDVYWIAIGPESQTTGYLGFVRRMQITSSLDKMFKQKLQTNFIWISLGMILITGLITLPVARALVKPVIRLKQATRELASGNYKARIENSNNDEIGELGTDFNSLAATLEKNLQARQQWIADISHELRTPVAILRGEIEAVQDGVRNLSKETIQSLHQETMRLNRLVDDLHELSLSDMGALSYQKEDIDVIEVITDVLHDHQAQAKQKSLKLSLKSNTKQAILHGDGQRLEQLFANLINNSIFYTNTGGNILVEVNNTNGVISIAWSDSSPGVKDADLEHLFDRLYRAEASRNRNTGGSGLGLAICKNIVEAHQGYIETGHSALGGLTITITFNNTKG